MKLSFTRLFVFICAPLIFVLASCSDDLTGSEDEESTSNSAPVAELATDSETVSVGEEVTLDASGSSDPDGDDLSYEWKLNKPDNSDAQLSDAQAEEPVFTPDVAGDYEAILEVSDGNNASDEDQVMVTAELNVIEISDDISESGTWTSDNLYRITTEVNVLSGAILTVQAGVTVEFTEDAGLAVDSDEAALQVEGTETDSVTFTGVEKESGFWLGLAFYSSHESNKLAYTTVEYGGSGERTFFNEQANVALRTGSQVTLHNSTIQHSSNHGLVGQSNISLPDFANNSFTANKIPIEIPTTAMGYMDTGSSFVENQNDYVLVSDWDIESSVTVKPLDVPYRLKGEPAIEDGGKLSVEAGTIMEFEDEAGLSVGSNNGSLVVEGQEDNPVTFTGAEKEPGYWLGLYIDSNNPENKLEHTIVEYGGSGSWIHMNGSANISMRPETRLALSHSTIRHSSDYGLYSYDNPDLSGFESNTFTQNNVPVYIATATMGVLDPASSYSGNENNYVLVYEQDVEHDVIVSELEVPYRIQNTPEIFGDAKVTIEAGVDMHFEENGGLAVTSDDAVLDVNGTEDNITTLRGVEETSGYWKGILIESSNPDNNIEHTMISYGGSRAWTHFNDPANISLENDSQLTLMNSLVENSDGYGVTIKRRVDFTSTNNSFKDNADGNIRD